MILIGVSILGAFAWLIALIYVVIPVLSAAFISRDGRDKSINETAVPESLPFVSDSPSGLICYKLWRRYLLTRLLRTRMLAPTRRRIRFGHRGGRQ